MPVAFQPSKPADAMRSTWHGHHFALHIFPKCDLGVPSTPNHISTKYPSCSLGGNPILIVIPLEVLSSPTTAHTHFGFLLLPPHFLPLLQPICQPRATYLFTQAFVFIKKKNNNHTHTYKTDTTGFFFTNVEKEIGGDPT